MKELLANIQTVIWFSNDIHYRGRDENFYGMHLLADRIRDFGSSSDDVKECYYMGFLRTDPPLDTEIAGLSVKEYDGIAGKTVCPTCRLVCALTNTMCLVEQAKREEGIPAGVHAILDSISQHAVTMRGLLERTMPVKE